MAVANVALEVSRRGIRVESVSRAESVEHRLSRGLGVEETFGPDDAVAAASVEDEHRVVDLSAWENVDGDVRCECGLGVF